jgi:LemA protein
MLKGMLVMAIYILIAAALVLLVGFIWLYNLLVSQWQMVNNGWADIDVQLKRRPTSCPASWKW